MQNYKMYSMGGIDLMGDFRIVAMTDNLKNIVRNEVEKLLFRYGFAPAVVKLAQKTINGTEKIRCYRNGDLYCQITICPHTTISGELKDWVLIEYADSLYEAERWMFEDGDMIPLDIHFEQIIAELEEELTRLRALGYLYDAGE